MYQVDTWLKGIDDSKLKLLAISLSVSIWVEWYRYKWS